ncbi:MAG: SUMF1/EgtB/PvdO family nonheme iron enzyme [Verrucomicrobiota bacterium]|jgi:formylglycine-generating enzyme required for sulfatase activity
MKTRIKTLLTRFGVAPTRSRVLPAVLTSLSLMLAGPATAQLTITLSGTNVVLTWPTNDGVFTLLSATNLVSPVNWTAVSGQNAVTNPISGTQQFYQLMPPGMALIPAGSFTMGDTLDGETDAIPTNVFVSAFYMDTNLVSSNQWQSVYTYATNQGYTFVNAGSDKATNYPVELVDWYDCVKWCNARSAQARLTPVYYTDTNLTQIFTSGDNGTTVYANWGANGYRLPTEAEWEKAARGGLSGQRFPWGLTISESQANYYPGSTNSYDLGGTQIYGGGASPWTSPVGTFPANGYGLNDMAGNLWEWCWDWYAGPTYPAGSPYLGGTDPRGPVGPLSDRVRRGGSWFNVASFARCACRNDAVPYVASSSIGFRCVRGL